jgi:ribosomal subunit interface protein
MQVHVTGKHVDVGEALRSRIADELVASIGRYFERGGDADVVLCRDGHGFRIDCAVTLASGQRLQSHGLGGDAHGAFNQALSKIETRIRRSKAAEVAALYILRAPEGEGEAEDWDESAGAPPPAAMVIAESQAELKTMTVSMAVMDLDLTEQAAIVFRNAAHGGLSVVYRRPDGNIGWIDPERTRANNGGGPIGRH